jgi:hypothetical protein
MTLYTVSSCRVSPQNEFLNVFATYINEQMNLNIGSSWKVSYQYELLNVAATFLSRQMTWNTVSSCKVSPQNEFLNVLANQMTEKMTLNIGSSCKVSRQYELLYVFSISISWQMTWNTGCNGGVWSAWSLLPIVEASGLNLCSARHPLLLLIYLESERSLSAHPPALLCFALSLGSGDFQREWKDKGRSSRRGRNGGGGWDMDGKLQYTRSI